MTIIEGKANLERAAMAQCIAALRLEVKSGMRSKTNWLAHTKKLYKLRARTRVDCLAQVEALYLKTYGKAYGA